MIFPRPSSTRLYSLLFLLAVATAGRAETTDHVATSPEHSTPSADAPIPPAPASGPVAPESVQPVAGHTADPAHENAAPPAAGIAVAVAKGPSGAKPPVNEDARREINGLLTLGGSLAERGDWEAAEIALRQVLAYHEATDDDLAKALIALARVYRRQGSLTKAAAIYERYLKDYPASDQVPDALLELGRTQRALGAHQIALTRFYNVINSTLKLSSEGFAHYQMLARTAQFEIAETHFQQGDYVEANKYFSRLRLLDLAPADRARAHFKSASALYLGGDYEGTVRTLNSYLEEWPQDENVPEARYLLSLSLRALGRKQEALDATLQLLRGEQAASDPKRWAYWQRRTGNQLANDFFQNGDTMNALAIYQGLSALSPDPAWRLPISYQIGLCYERMRLYDRASNTYKSIVEAAAPAPASAAETKPAAESAAVESVAKSATEPGEKARNFSAELTELARMAAWRVSQLEWHEQTEHQLTSLFTTTSPTRPAPPAPHATVSNIDHNATSEPTPAPAHDHTTNPPVAASSL